MHQDALQSPFLLRSGVEFVFDRLLRIGNLFEEDDDDINAYDRLFGKE